MGARIALFIGAIALLVAGAGAYYIVTHKKDLAAASTDAAPTGSRSPSPQASSCAPWDCAQTARFDAAKTYLATVKNGHIGIEVKDRVTGAVWTGGEPDFRIWGSSTPKLAFAVSLLEQDRAGQLTLSAQDHTKIDAMLHISDDNAADTLWDRYADPSAMLSRWRSTYGMTTAGYVTGFPSRWGFVKETPKDLVALMTYVLEKLNATDRAYILHAMTNVGDIQHWGVWGAGAALQPGVKDGWSVEKDNGQDHWVNSTVGFVGPQQRYVVGAMYHQNPGGDSNEKGVHTLTDLIATVFGAPVPAPVVIPPDGT
jgi:hypothetical protein